MDCPHRTLPLLLNLLCTPLSCSSIGLRRLYNTDLAVRKRMRALALTASSHSNPLRSAPLLLKALNAAAGSQSNVASSETTEWAMQDFYGLRKDVEAVAKRVEEVRAATSLQWLEADLSVLERKAADSSLWDDPPKAQEILLALTDVKDKIKQVKEFKSQFD